MKILIDNREQLPLPFKIAGNVSQIISTKLDFGDYAVMMEPTVSNPVGHIPPIFFERKSAQDCYSTLTVGMERFKKEIQRSQDAGAKLYLIIEGTLTDILDGVRFSQTHSDTIVKTIFTLKVKYGIEPVFCESREEMVRYIIETFEAFGRAFKKLPLNEAVTTLNTSNPVISTTSRIHGVGNVA